MADAASEEEGADITKAISRMAHSMFNASCVPRVWAVRDCGASPFIRREVALMTAATGKGFRASPSYERISILDSIFWIDAATNLGGGRREECSSRIEISALL